MGVVENDTHNWLFLALFYRPPRAGALGISTRAYWRTRLGSDLCWLANPEHLALEHLLMDSEAGSPPRSGPKTHGGNRRRPDHVATS